MVDLPAVVEVVMAVPLVVVEVKLLLISNKQLIESLP